jgi:hypothetical protein
MCLPVSRLFWVSSLAYPNLLGTKGYVVVVVVVSIPFVIWTLWFKNEWDVLPVLFQLAKILAIFI